MESDDIQPDAAPTGGEGGGNGVGNVAGTQSAADMERILDAVSGVGEQVAYVQDLFTRRLADDKQKKALIAALTQQATFAVVEPFVHDLVLVLDRLEQRLGDEFDASVYDEISELLERRGVERVAVTEDFDPSRCRAVRAIDDPGVDRVTVTGVIRNGYTLSGRVIRPAEVTIARPAPATPPAAADPTDPGITAPAAPSTPI